MSAKQEIRELDKEFGAPGSTMLPDTYNARREEIRARQTAERERAEDEAEAARAAARPAGIDESRLNAVLRPAKPLELDTAEAAELKRFNERFEHEAKAGAPVAAKLDEIVTDSRRVALSKKSFSASIAGFFHTLHKRFGARSAVVAAQQMGGRLFHELNETRLSAAVLRARTAKLEKRMQELETAAESVEIKRQREARRAEEHREHYESMTAAVQIELREVKSKAFRYCGVWSEKESYDENDFVTHDGSMWGALADTKSRPGSDSTWQLAVKHGRDLR